mmetsp:Transcript_17311/g.40252  ORF Transcript_17311/g.40252 Transcript_17311/m.40252 type:complete len:233 (-) Transcript_17311:955-1653(-)
MLQTVLLQPQDPRGRDVRRIARRRLHEQGALPLPPLPLEVERTLPRHHPARAPRRRSPHPPDRAHRPVPHVRPACSGLGRPRRAVDVAVPAALAVVLVVARGVRVVRLLDARVRADRRAPGPFVLGHGDRRHRLGVLALGRGGVALVVPGGPRAGRALSVRLLLLHHDGLRLLLPPSVVPLVPATVPPEVLVAAQRLRLGPARMAARRARLLDRRGGGGGLGLAAPLAPRPA